jgi:hypothetical protein
VLTKFWDFTVRFRTWLIGAIGMIALFLPDLITVASELLNSPQIVAVLPQNWKAYAGAIGFICLVWSRWRPAARTADTEVQVKKEIEKTDAPSTVKVIEGGTVKAVIRG